MTGRALLLVAGDLAAVFLPGQSMLGASLQHRGEEILRRVDDLERAAAKGSTAGIPLLHPWANRLSGTRYEAAGRDVELDLRSPLLHLDARGLPMHGVPWSRLAWEVTEASAERITARLEWNRAELLAIFPYPHVLEMETELRPGSLTISTTLEAGREGPVPVSFGFHPYVGLPGLPRSGCCRCLPCGGSSSTHAASPTATLRRSRDSKAHWAMPCLTTGSSWLAPGGPSR